MYKAYVRINGKLTNVYVKNNHMFEILVELYTRFGVAKIALIAVKGME